MGRYRRIDPRIWHDDKFPKLSDDAKLLFFLILTSPRSTMVGLFVQGESDMADYLGWTRTRLRKPFRELLREQLICYDEKTRLIYLPKFLKYNPLENENQAKAAAKQIGELPRNAQFFQHVKQYLEQLAKPFLEPLIQTMGVDKETVTATPEPEPEQEQEPLPEPDHPLTPSRGFEAFWALYPRRVGKGAAEQVWNHLAPNNGQADAIYAAVRAQSQCAQWRKNSGQFIPHPRTWLSQRRWEDETDGARSEHSGSQAFLTLAADLRARARGASRDQRNVGDPDGGVPAAADEPGDEPGVRRGPG